MISTARERKSLCRRSRIKKVRRGLGMIQERERTKREETIIASRAFSQTARKERAIFPRFLPGLLTTK